eukprot:5152417-Pleurochrysis_carterae.AAC.3
MDRDHRAYGWKSKERGYLTVPDYRTRTELSTRNSEIWTEIVRTQYTDIEMMKVGLDSARVLHRGQQRAKDPAALMSMRARGHTRSKQPGGADARTRSSTALQCNARQSACMQNACMAGAARKKHSQRLPVVSAGCSSGAIMSMLLLLFYPITAACSEKQSGLLRWLCTSTFHIPEISIKTNDSDVELTGIACTELTLGGLESELKSESPILDITVSDSSIQCQVESLTAGGFSFGASLALYELGLAVGLHIIRDEATGKSDGRTACDSVGMAFASSSPQAWLHSASGCSF